MKINFAQKRKFTKKMNISKKLTKWNKVRGYFVEKGIRAK